MFSEFTDIITAARVRNQDKLYKQIDDLTKKIEEIQKYSDDILDLYKAELYKFENMFKKYGYNCGEFAAYNLESDRCPFKIWKDKSFKIPVVIARKKKKGVKGEFYIAFVASITLAATLVKSGPLDPEDNVDTLRNAMYKIPRIHMQTGSDPVVIESFFRIADSLSQFWKTGSEQFYGICDMTREKLKLLKDIEVLE